MRKYWFPHCKPLIVFHGKAYKENGDFPTVCLIVYLVVRQTDMDKCLFSHFMPGIVSYS